MDEALAAIDVLRFPNVFVETISETLDVQTLLKLPETYAAVLDETLNTLTVITFQRETSADMPESATASPLMLRGVKVEAAQLDTLSLDGAFEYLRTVSTHLPESFGASDELSNTALRHAFIQQMLRVVDSVNRVLDKVSVYAVDRVTGATTRYEDFDFKSYFQLGRHTYGVKPGGVYKLGGPTDAGKEVKFHIDFGKTDFSTRAKKTLHNVYIEADGTASAKLLVSDDRGNTFEYATQTNEQLRTAKVRIGRGLTASMYSLKLHGEAEENFDISNIEVLFDVSDRRV
jgi:hypothetical protein